MVKTAIALLPEFAASAVRPVAPRLLSFTVVVGYLRGEHTCPYELHATGCRDLKKMVATQPSYEVRATDPKAAIAEAVTESGGMTKSGAYWIQPCCSLVRMKAAGRA